MFLQPQYPAIYFLFLLQFMLFPSLPHLSFYKLRSYLLLKQDIIPHLCAMFPCWCNLNLSSCTVPVFIWFSLHLKEWNLFFETKLSSSTLSVLSSRTHYSSCLSYKYLGGKIAPVSLATFPSLFLEYPAFLPDFVKHACKASST